MRVKAFTMVEILTGLLIGSIVIVLAVVSIYELDSLHKGFRERTERAAKRSRLYDLIYCDMEEAVRIHASETNDGMYTIYERPDSDSRELLYDSIYYKFEEDNIRRTQGDRTDTFHLDMKMPLIENAALDKNIITRLSIETEEGSWIFTKQYPATVLLNKKLNQPEQWR